MPDGTGFTGKALPSELLDSTLFSSAQIQFKCAACDDVIYDIIVSSADWERGINDGKPIHISTSRVQFLHSPICMYYQNVYRNLTHNQILGGVGQRSAWHIPFYLAVFSQRSTSTIPLPSKNIT